jgi:hypothetical protein
MSERLNPEVLVRVASPNVSERLGSISLIVLHDTESSNIAGSIADLQGVADWFANPASEVSAHVVTDADGHSARCVADYRKAWQCVDYNSAALGIEQCGFAAQKAWDPLELEESARWIAYWSHRHRLPIRRALVAGGRVLRSGVTTHSRLGAAGGSHHDPGTDYPFAVVLRRARAIKRARYG